jgi:hypothetical protein
MKYFKLFSLFLFIFLLGCSFNQKVEYPNKNIFNIDNSCQIDQDCEIVYKGIGCNSCNPCLLDRLDSYVSVNAVNYFEFKEDYSQKYCSQEFGGFLDCPSCVTSYSNEGVDLEAKCIDNQCSKFGNKGY